MLKVKKLNEKIEIMENIHDKNEKLASEINRKMTAKGVFVINVIGSPGAGKTTSLINLTKLLDKKSYIIEGDIESDIDAKKLSALGIRTAQINTGGACHLETTLIEAALPDDFTGGFLFIENIGNLVCPAEFMVGEHIKMLISSVAEGSDKPYKYPLAFEKADIIILNKCDLTPYLDFDENFFINGVRKLNKTVTIIKTSGKTGEGFKEAAKWLTARMKEMQSALS